MKKLFTILIPMAIGIILPASLFAQSPEKMSYQAVIRNSSNELVIDQSIGMQVSILKGGEEGMAVYVERHFPATNENGLVSLAIGMGTVISGSFNSIEWESDTYYVKVETDLNGGADYTIEGISQLLTVPYALHAKTAESLTGGITETDPSFNAWDKSTGILITESQISDLGNYVETETDPDVPSGNQPGEIQYWDGSEWVTLAAGNEGQFLTFTDGIPTWTTTVGTNDVQNPTTGKIWMDRNLGALQVATSSTDADAYGDLYQWGRGADGHEKRTSGITSTLSSSDTPGHGDFITNSSSPNDWRSPQNDLLWQGLNGTNNPCPGGYRLPTDAEWEAERASWSSNNSAGALASLLKLPLAGFRSVSNGSLQNVGSAANYWSSTLDGTRARYLFFFSNDAYMTSYHRAYGFSMRCIKD